MDNMATTPLPAKTRTAATVAIPGLWWKLLTGLWMSAGILGAFLLVGPVLNDQGQPLFTMGGHGAKAFFFHMPNAWIATLTYVFAAVYAFNYLRKKDFRDDLRCAAMMELGLLFSFLATVTGSIFAHNEWGSYWNWDPRETSIIVIMLLYAAYLVLRGALTEPEKRARLSSVYALVALVPGLFLIWVLPRIVETLHGEANKGVVGGGIGGQARIVFYSMVMPAFLALFAWLYQLRFRVLKLEARQETGL